MSNNEFNKDVRELLIRTKTLASRKILSAPVVAAPEGTDPTTFTANTEDQDIVCFVDIRDILESFLKELPDDVVHKAKMLKRMQVLEEKGVAFATRPLSSLPAIGSDGTFYQVKASAMSVMELVYDALLYPRETKAMHGGKSSVKIVHRIALFDSKSRITHILSQSDIARFLFEHKAELGALAGMTAAQLGWSGRPVVSVTPDTCAMVALSLMADKAIAGLGVVSQTGALIGNFSYSDLRTMCADHFSTMALPVAEFLALEHGTEYSGARASKNDEEESMPAPRGAGGFPGNRLLRRRSSVGYKVGQELVLATPDDTFYQILQKLVQNHLHRLYIVDEATKPVGVVTLTDILRVVTDQSK
ncbi:g11966 [Coccomyxa viridis]|uniref:G11966 protein n=1 Tax=Coccomyxa viridis TaxID=1274662 RepID=A0ABP1GDB9_9CHLO